MKVHELRVNTKNLFRVGEVSRNKNNNLMMIEVAYLLRFICGFLFYVVAKHFHSLLHESCNSGRFGCHLFQRLIHGNVGVFFIFIFYLNAFFYDW